MNSLSMNIRELKENLMNANVMTIKKIKSKPIESNLKNIDEKNLILEYNYYVRLIKRIKNYIILNKYKDIILKTLEHKSSNIVCIATTIEKEKLDIGLNIDIKIITGNDCSSMLDCTYYDTNDGGLLYLNDFRSSRPKQGYGEIILSNLDEIVHLINKSLNKMGYESIMMAQGVMIPNKNIIKEDELRRFYLKHDFSIDKNNVIKRYIKAKEKEIQN